MVGSAPVSLRAEEVRTRQRVRDELGYDVDRGGMDEDDGRLLVELAPDRVEALVADEGVAVCDISARDGKLAHVVMITKPCGAGSSV